MVYYGPERKNQRLKNYDYSQAGYYFITFCTKGRIDYFGKIINGEMILNDYGRIIQEGIITTQGIRNEIAFDEYVIMPNHIHIIIIVKNTQYDNSVGNVGIRSNSTIRSDSGIMKKSESGPHACGSYECVPYENPIMNKTKNIVSNTIQGLKAHVTKNEEQLEKTREYIILNPVKWEYDINNPKNIELGNK